MTDEFQLIKKYKIADGDFRNYDTRKCIYEGKLVEAYYDINDGFFIRDINTLEHLGYAEDAELQPVELVPRTIQVTVSVDPVNFKYDSIGTLYVLKKDNVLYVSTSYNEDETIMIGVCPWNRKTLRLKADELAYASYSKN